MRQRAVRSAGDDRLERSPRGAPAAHLELELGRELRLGHALGEALLGLSERDVGDAAGPLDPGDLPGVLHEADRLDEPGGRDELGPHGGGKLALERPAHGFGLEGDPGEVAGRRLDRLDLLRRVDHRELDVDPGRRRLGRGLVLVAPVGDEQARAAP